MTETKKVSVFTIFFFFSIYNEIVFLSFKRNLFKSVLENIKWILFLLHRNENNTISITVCIRYI